MQLLSGLGDLPLRANIAITAIVGLLFFAVAAAVRWVLSTLRPKAFPPGPPVIPGIGNILDVPIQKPYLKFDEWAKQYGDIVGLKVGAGNLVLLNTAELVHELLDKRANIYSARQINHVLTKHVVYKPEERQLAILQYDGYYRRMRKAMQHMVSGAAIKREIPLLESEACLLSLKMLDGGKDYHKHMRHWAIAAPLVATTGERLDDLPASYAAELEHSQDELLKLIIPGAGPPVDVFPILKYVPEFLASWKTKAREARRLLLNDANNYVEGARKQLRQIMKDPNSIGFQSMLTKIMLEQKASKSGKGMDEHFTETELGFVGQASVGAAVDTTLATTQSLMCAFAAYPTVLAKAQEEVDRVGAGKPPSGDQLNELTYLKACVMEVLRWRPTTPSALPHALEKDDTFGPYFFPKGTIFIANAWTINNNDRDYDAPEEFRPERFLANRLGLKPSVYSPEVEGAGRRAHYAFGAGRRQCPGEQFAFTQVILAAAKILWTHEVLPPPGGVDVSIETGFHDGTVTSPKDPRVVFRLRGPERKVALEEDYKRTDAITRDLLGF